MSRIWNYSISLIGGVIIGSLYFSMPLDTITFLIAFMVIMVLGIEEVCKAIRSLKETE